MNCPICGEALQKGKNVCLRCGYAFRSLILHADNGQNDGKNDQGHDADFKEIHEDEVRFGSARSSGGGGSIFDSLFGGSIFDGLFGGGGGIGSMIDDIFGGLFGESASFSTNFFDDDEDDDPQLYDEFGRPIGIDVFKKNDCIEVHDVECYDEHGNLKEKKPAKKSKNPFNRFKKQDEK